MSRFYWGALCGLFLGVAITAALLGHWVWVSLGAVPFLGGILQGIMKRKINKALDISPTKPHAPVGSQTRNQYSSYNEEGD